MNNLKVVRWTGACGVIASILFLLLSLLYNMVIGTAPSLGNEALFTEYVIKNNTIHIIALFVDVVYLVGFMVFAAGLRYLIRRVRPDDEWLATLAFGSALVMTANLLIFEALWGGAVLDTFTKPDPTVMRGLTEVAIVSQVLGLIPTALFLAAAGYAITRALPRQADRQTGWIGIFYAVLVLAAVLAVVLEFFLGNRSVGVRLGGQRYEILIVCMFTCVIGGWMMSMKREALATKPRERELQEVQ